MSISRRWLLIVVAALCAVALVVVPDDPLMGWVDSEPDPAATLTPSSGRPFAPESAFNTPIGSDPEVDPRSESMVDLLAGGGEGIAVVYKYVPPVYDADEDTPRHSIECTESWGSCDLEQGPVPIPDGARPSPGADGNMVVIDWSIRTVYEFFRYDPERKTVEWGAVLPLDGPGTGNAESDPGRYGAVGAGISRLAGIVRPWEIVQGEIPHALVGPAGHSCEDTYRYPAVKTDGWSDHPDCIPEGARIQLDPAVRCEELPDIEPWQVTVCRALQEYGWYNIDNGEPGQQIFSVQFENPAGGDNPYPELGIDDNSSLGPIPMDRLRVLRSWNSFS